MTLTNNQSVALSITSLTGLPAAYSLDTTNTTCQQTPLTVPANTSCVFAVSLTATAKGSQAGTVTVNYGGGLPSQSFGLTGNAIQPVLISPTALSFAAQFVGAQSAPQPVTVTNEQNVALSIASATITGNDPNDFTITANTCPIAPATLPASTPCGVQVAFTPTASGTRTATLSIADNAPTSPQTVTLTGPGNAPVTVLPGAITNYTAPVGTTSAYQTFTITNAQAVSALIFSNLQLIGDFIQSATTCPIGGAGLAAGGTCTVSVEFDPTIGGVRTGQLQVYDNAITSPQVVNLSGTGTSPLTITPGTLSFTTQQVTTVSPAKTITLTNHETESESFTLTPSGDYTANTNCVTGVIAANSSCLIYVTFAPTSATPSTRTGSVTIGNSAPGGGALVASLTGSASTTPPAAAVAVVSPGAGSAGTQVNVAITGNGWTHFNASSALNFVQTDNNTVACGLTISAQNAVSANEIDATLTLAGGTDAVFGACDLSVVTPLTGGGNETASLIQAFIIADPNLSHSITSVTPAAGAQGQTLNVSADRRGNELCAGHDVCQLRRRNHRELSHHTDDLTERRGEYHHQQHDTGGYRTITMVTGGEFATSALTPQLATRSSRSRRITRRGEQ